MFWHVVKRYCFSSTFFVCFNEIRLVCKMANRISAVDIWNEGVFVENCRAYAIECEAKTEGNWREMWKWTVEWIALWRAIDFAECFLSRKKYVYRKMNKPSSGFAYSLMNAGKTNGIPVFHVTRSCASQNLSIFSLTSGWVPCRMGMSISWQPSKRIFPCECQRFGNWIFRKYFLTLLKLDRFGFQDTVVMIKSRNNDDFTKFMRNEMSKLISSQVSRRPAIRRTTVNCSCVIRTFKNTQLLCCRFGWLNRVVHVLFTFDCCLLGANCMDFE